MRKLVAATMTLAVLLGHAAWAQAPSDLFGAWVLLEVPGSTAALRPAESLTIREVEARAPTGGSIPPAAFALAVERRTGTDVHHATIEIGLNGGVSGGTPAGPAGQPRVDTNSQWSTRWADGHLIVWRFDRTATNGQVADTETTEDWSINSAGQLVISTSFRQTGHEPDRTTITYRRR